MGSALARTLVWLIDHIACRYRGWQDRERFSSFSDNALRDIGIDRDEIERDHRSWFRDLR
jgi:uncharacterized protein YjiS (DUF1127 family)